LDVGEDPAAPPVPVQDRLERRIDEVAEEVRALGGRSLWRRLFGRWRRCWPETASETGDAVFVADVTNSLKMREIAALARRIIQPTCYKIGRQIKEVGFSDPLRACRTANLSRASLVFAGYAHGQATLDRAGSRRAVLLGRRMAKYDPTTTKVGTITW
jgi:hypothetical protein